MRILISGSYGTGNCGDEIILDGVLNAFEGHDITVFSKNASYTRKHFNVPAVPEIPPLRPITILKDLAKGRITRITDRIRAIQAMRRADAFVMGGGGLLAELIPEVLAFHLSQLRLAKRLGKRVVLFSVGVGPLRTPAGIALTRDTLNECVDYISVRDKHSKELLEKIGVSKPVHLLPDPAVHFRIDRKSGNNTVVFNFYRAFSDSKVFPGQQHRLESLKSAIIDITHHLIQNRKMRVHYLAFGAKDDFDFVAELCRKVGSPLCTRSAANDDFRKLSAQLGSASFVIAMRFHAGLVAMANSIPAICIDQQYKSERLLTDIGLLNVLVDIPDGFHKAGNNDIKIEEVKEKIDYLVQNKSEIVNRLDKYFDEQRRQYDHELKGLTTATFL